MSEDLPDALARRLKAATRRPHVALERSALMRTLLRGQMSRVEYTALVRQLAAIYDALERHLSDRADSPVICLVWRPTLKRSAHLEQDLDTLHGPDWRGLPVHDATRDYVDHLHALAAKRPERLLGHVYVRYLGDLNGGQRLQGIVRTGLALDGPAGTRFYDFGAPERVAEHIASLRAGLDAVGERFPEYAEGIVDEALVGFDLHARLFDALSPQA